MATYTAFPHDHPAERTLCIICYKAVSLNQTTAGSLHADGKQAFACDQHLYNREIWITAWALFDVKQEAMTHVISDQGQVS
jgi:hypothetical protein